jgi:hypothetical protein
VLRIVWRNLNQIAGRFRLHTLESKLSIREGVIGVGMLPKEFHSRIDSVLLERQV